MLALCAVLALLAIDSLVPYLNSYLSAGLTLSALLLCVLTLRLVRREFFGPLRELQHWALQIRGGTLSARIDCPSDSDFNELAQDINFIGEPVLGGTEARQDVSIAP